MAKILGKFLYPIKLAQNTIVPKTKTIYRYNTFLDPKIIQNQYIYSVELNDGKWKIREILCDTYVTDDKIL